MRKWNTYERLRSKLSQAEWLSTGSATVSSYTKHLYPRDEKTGVLKHLHPAALTKTSHRCSKAATSLSRCHPWPRVRIRSGRPAVGSRSDWRLSRQRGMRLRECSTAMVDWYSPLPQGLGTYLQTVEGNGAASQAYSSMFQMTFSPLHMPWAVNLGNHTYIHYLIKLKLRWSYLHIVQAFVLCVFV